MQRLPVLDTHPHSQGKLVNHLPPAFEIIHPHFICFVPKKGRNGESYTGTVENIPYNDNKTIVI